MSFKPKIVLTPYHKRKKKKKYKRIFIFILFFFVFFALGAYFLLSWIIRKESKDLERLRLENQKLKTEVREFQSSDKAYEEYLRVKMGYIAEGEKIILYKGNTGKP
ncbi:MAG: FtsB family cell division protein [Caldimicrobium sp.]